MKMNWKCILGIVLTTSILACWACSDDGNGKKDPQPEVKGKLEVSTKGIDLKAEGGVTSFKVTAEGKDWAMEVIDESGKIEVTPKKGEVGVTEISVSAVKNETEDLRKAVLMIRLADKSDSVQVMVNQLGIITKYTRKTDSLALVSLFNALDGAKWSSVPSGGKMEGFGGPKVDVHYPWDLKKPLDAWYGVTLETVGDEMRVTGLKMPMAGAVGKIPEQLTHLRELESLEFPNAIEISGTFPEDIFRLTKCQRLIVREGGLLNVNLSDRIKEMTALKVFDLQGITMAMESVAKLYDVISLDSLSILTGAIAGELPAGISRLNHLKYLCLNNCSRISGLPDDLCQLEGLESLFLVGCSELERLPEQIGDLKHLKQFSLSSTPNVKSLPASFSQLTALEELDLRIMNLTGNADELFTQMKNLRILYAEHNQFTGTLDWLKGKALVELFMGDNKLKGELSIPDMFTGAITHLMLGNNGITGTLTGIGALKKLEVLSFAGCQLSGGLPPEMGQLSLQTGYLNDNNLEGNIPVELKDIMKEMTTPLSLTGNRLSGTLPREVAEAWLPQCANAICRQQPEYGFTDCEN